MNQTTDPITIKIDGEALRIQVEGAIAKAMEEAAWQLRNAADILDRGKWIEDHARWTKEDVERRVAERLKEADNG